MPHLETRDVPEEVHQVLMRRAEASGRTLEQYLTQQLVQMAETPTQSEVLDRIERRAKGRVTAEDAVAAIEAERSRRLMPPPR